MLLFPSAFPETVVLRSRAAPVPPGKLTPHCVEEDFSQLLSRQPAEAVPGCDATPFLGTQVVVDAGPLVLRALQIFDADSKFRPEQLAAKGPEVQTALRNAVRQALTLDPPQVRVLPSAPAGSAVDRRWLIEAIEIAIVEGLTLQRNVRNILIERHTADTDEAATDP